MLRHLLVPGPCTKAAPTAAAASAPTAAAAAAVATALAARHQVLRPSGWVFQKTLRWEPIWNHFYLLTFWLSDITALR